MTRITHTFLRLCIAVALCATACRVAAQQDYQLSALQPIAADSGYVVQWDCSANNGLGDWHKDANGNYANEMEWDETFFLAIDLTGTKLGEWAAKQPTNPGAQRVICCDAFRIKDNIQTEFDDHGARLWHLRDNIYGAVYNFAQRAYKQPSTSYRPTRGKKDAVAFKLFGAETPFYGKNCVTPEKKGDTWWIWPNGWTYQAAFIIPTIQNNLPNQNKCTFKFASYTGTHTATQTLQTNTQTDDLTYIYNDYGILSNPKLVTAVGYASPFGPQSPCPATEFPTDYEVSATNASICPPSGEYATISLSGSQNGFEYLLYRNGNLYTGTYNNRPVNNPVDGTGSGLTWYVDQVGTYEVYARKKNTSMLFLMTPCSGVSSAEVALGNNCCPEFEWAIDGIPGLATPMYPGGWYDISCTTDAGAPTIMATGTGVSIVKTTPNGKTTTIRIELGGNATGDINLKATYKTSSNRSCEDTKTITIAPCEGMTPDTWKVEWYNYNGSTSFPQYWIHNGSPVYLRDNNGKLEADIVHNDGQDEWWFLPTGKQKNGYATYYIRNGLTRRYLYRGAQHGNMGSDWEYADALLSNQNGKTEDYEWLFYTHTNGDVAFVCANGFTGSNFKNGAYMLHVRPWEAPMLFSNPSVTSPGMVCGKMANQEASPVFYMKSKQHPAVSLLSVSVSLGWKNTAPSSPVSLYVGNSLTFTAERIDDIHSINRNITYSSSASSVVTVDANGQITAVSGGTATISVTIEKVGCFDGDVLNYTVNVIECGAKPVLSIDENPVNVNSQWTIQVTNPAVEGEELVEWGCVEDLNRINSQGVFTAPGYPCTSTITYKIINTGHPECNREAEPLVIQVVNQDLRLPNQPKTSDGACYIVKWDCAKNDFADANDMEWGETFVFAVNLKGTPLGEWIKKGSSDPNLVRSVACVRFSEKNNENKQFNLDASRLWHIRDEIYGATYNFSQIPYQNGQNYTVRNGQAPEIAIQLYGFETAMGTRCAGDEKTHAGNWYEWSDAGNCQRDWQNGDEWRANSFVSLNNQYMFKFAPSTGKQDAAINTQTDDDLRDQWYDNGHYFNRPGYASPCPKVWPEKQSLSVSPAEICVEKNETATITLGGAETDWTYLLYQNGVKYTGATKTGNSTWTVNTPGTYQVYAQANDETSAHSDFMGQCGGAVEVTVKAKADCEDKEECPPTQTFSEQITRCEADEAFAWRGHSVTRTGVYRDTVFSSLSDGTRCEKDIYTLTFTLIQTIEHPEETVTQCDTLGAYTWRNQSLTRTGIYRDTIYTPATDSKCPSEIYTLNLTLTPCEREPEPCINDIHRKWNDLLFVDNSTDQYVAYQWYRNNQPLEGENRQYYYVEGQILSGDGYTYHCVMTTTNGAQVTACAGLFDTFTASVSDHSPNGNMTFSPRWTRSGGEVSILGIVPEQGYIYSAMGQQVMTINGTSFVPQLPPGCYLVQVKDTDGMLHCDKLIIK